MYVCIDYRPNSRFPNFSITSVWWQCRLQMAPIDHDSNTLLSVWCGLGLTFSKSTTATAASFIMPLSSTNELLCPKWSNVAELVNRRRELTNLASTVHRLPTTKPTPISHHQSQGWLQTDHRFKNFSNKTFKSFTTFLCVYIVKLIECASFTVCQWPICIPTMMN